MWRLLFGAVTVVAMVGGGVSGGEPAVAVVNVPVVSERYAKTADLETRFDALRDQITKERDALRTRAERTARSLQEEFKPGTDDYRTRRKELAMLEAELEYFMESEGKQIEAGLARSLRAIFDDIHAMIRMVAEEKDVDLVLAIDDLPDEVPGSPNVVRQQIVLKKVLYWNSRVDLTEEVISRLNAQYKAAGGKSSLGSARETATDSALARGEAIGGSNRE